MNVTGLLAFMLGPTRTAKYPVADPEATVKVTEVLLQEFIVIDTPLNITKLLPCEAPKLDPVIVTWLPIDPVVAERLLMTGAGAAVELIDTLSNVAVANAVVLLPVTARPI